ncbi:SIR2 family NAD-dependent protein deacylase [Xanthovirga aplysinae]|uniref:SIR2 family NAD-dependent protein deacylase n=1 Tax=Xanthovirga aplysinae TaxID=2529853 RepID=UPI0012BD2656|nr:NAD-dependent deacylase [Xanthovirga aplysinae]MTI31292.1 NAD-dependent deacylase [Xanthovirga aplysinae]
MSSKNKIVVLSGAGISAESGIPTFRDANGLWEGYDVMDVATPEGWAKNPKMVLDFYNQRRRAVLDAHPNAGHFALAELEEDFEVSIVTQNIDNLHEKAGSSKVLHLHGEILKSQSSVDENLVYPIDGWEIKWGETCEKGSQLRPNVVWFGEAVPLFDRAIMEASFADIFVVVGTSMQVYPAAQLVDFISENVPIYVIDPKKPDMMGQKYDFHFIEKKASEGLIELKNILLKN